MKLRHPFEWLDITLQPRAFGLFFVLTIAAMLALQGINEPLKTAVAPAGIISFEFAGTLAVAQQMIESWGAVGRIHAGLSLGFDYLFLVLYPFAIGLGCVIVARAGFLSTLGILLAWGPWVAAVLDAIENYALIQLLLGAQDPALPLIAFWSAAPKFGLVALSVLYVLLGAFVVLFVKRRVA